MLPMNLIVAACENMGIGKGNGLPWPRLPNESKYFANMTTRTINSGKKNAVIMGRKTWESIPGKYRPLRDRLNIVISRTMTQNYLDGHEEAKLFHDFDEAVKYLNSAEISASIETIWNVGGSEMYKLGLRHPSFHRLYFTRVLSPFDCDTFFPPLDWDRLRRIEDPDVSSNVHEENGVRYQFEVYEREF